MKYWKEKENNPVEQIEFWQGKRITKLEQNEVFVMGTNPAGRHGSGAALQGVKFGASYGKGRGFVGQQVFGVITKNLEGNEGFVEKATGIKYDKVGFRSISTQMIRENIKELYSESRKPEHSNKKFLITYQFESWGNGTPKKSLNGYDSQEMLEMFAKDQDIPPNIVFHESYKSHLEKLFKKENRQSNVELVVFEDGKTIDIKEEDIVWTIDEDERNPPGYHGAGTAKIAVQNYGAVYQIGRGMQGNSYALVTKSLKKGYTEPSTGIKYEREGFKSVSPEMIRDNIDELYEVARQHPEKNFKIAYTFESWANGSPKKSLNGYNSQEILEMFVRDDIPPNIVFHESYKPHLEKIFNQRNANQSTNNMSNVSSFTTAQNVLPNLMVVSPRDAVPEGFTVLNTTSQDKNIGVQFSPFYLKDIPLYEGKTAKNMENAWQFAKVYKEFADEHGNPTDKYFEWANKGWNDSFAHRYANGKGNVPLYSYWKTFKDGQWQEHRYDYVTARKEIYFPLYAKAIYHSQAFKDLEQRVASGEKIALWDFDGYDHVKRNMSYEDVVNSDKYKCGHAFVIYGLLTKQLKIVNNELIYDFRMTHNKENMQENIPVNIPTKIQENTMPQQTNKENKQYTFFFHLTSPFSNFHPSKFEYKGLTFVSNEQFMMYSKAKTFNDDVIAQKIIDMNAQPLLRDFINGIVTRQDIVKNKALSDQWNVLMKSVKGLGREVKDFDEKIWEDRGAKNVLFGARLKFSQNEDLKQILLSTDKTYMVEASKYDKIWGNGLDEATSKRTPEDQWPGLNLLGKVLDYLKIEFNKKLVQDHQSDIDQSNNKVLHPNTEVVNFYQVGKVIPEDGTYLGRYNHNFNLPASKFANPFPVKDPSERGTTIEKYREWLWKQIAENVITKSDLLELNGKKLVCYCAPKACHAGVVKETLELLIVNEQQFDNQANSYKKKSSLKP